MGDYLHIRFLGAVSASFFEAQRDGASTLLGHGWDDLIPHIKLRPFLRYGGPIDLKIGLTRIESFNETGAQTLFAAAAIAGGLAGSRMARDLALLDCHQAAQIPPNRKADLLSTFDRLAALPQSRIRLPGGGQILLANPVEELLRQTDQLNSCVAELALCAYLPPILRDQPLTNFMESRAALLDRSDALRHGGSVSSYIRRAVIQDSDATSPALRFTQLERSAIKRADIIPQTSLTTRQGARYILSNSPVAIERLLSSPAPQPSPFLVCPPMRALM